MREIYKETPFKDPMVKLEEGSPWRYLLRFTNNQDRVVRVEAWYGIDSVSKVQKARELFSELENEYSIAIPKYDILLGVWPQEDSPAIYTVVEKINGVELSKANIPYDEAEAFCLNLLRYHIDKYQTGGYYLADLSEQQFLYGSSKNKIQKRIFLVDLDPFYEKYNPDNPMDLSNTEFFESLERLHTIIQILEKSVGSLKFPLVRQEFISFLNSIHGGSDFARLTIKDLLKELKEKEANSKRTTEDMGVG